MIVSGICEVVLTILTREIFGVFHLADLTI